MDLEMRFRSGVAIDQERRRVSDHLLGIALNACNEFSTGWL